MDEMLELFKGQLSYNTIKYELTYKEACKLRSTRVARLVKESEEIKKAQKEK